MAKQLPADICRCAATNCKAKRDCLRYTSAPTQTMWVSDFSVSVVQGDACEHMIKG